MCAAGRPQVTGRVRRLAGAPQTAPAITYLAQTLPAKFMRKTARGSANRHDQGFSCVGNPRSGRCPIGRCSRSRPDPDLPADQVSEGWSSGNDGFAPTPTPFMPDVRGGDIEISADAEDRASRRVRDAREGSENVKRRVNAVVTGAVVGL